MHWDWPADQNPGSPDNAYWLPFFNRMTPFVSGPERGARTNNMACVFGNFFKEKRGHFRFELELMTLTPNEFEPGQITRLYVDHLEKAIRSRPANYLWSHRRWKREYDEGKYGHLAVK